MAKYDKNELNTFIALPPSNAVLYGVKYNFIKTTYFIHMLFGAR